MKTMNFLWMMLTLLTLATLTSAQGTNEDKDSQIRISYTFCRLYKGFSRCVDEPLPYDKKRLWCPYHVCGPSFVKAKHCAAGDKRATHICRVVSRPVTGYYCRRENPKHRSFRVPRGCRFGRGRKCKLVRTCRCKRIRRRRGVYTPIRAIPAKLCKGRRE